MIASRTFGLAALGTWGLYVLALLLEASDANAAGMGVLPAAFATYAVTMLSLLAMPRWSLTELAAIPAAAMILPEVVVSAFSRGVTVGRPALEIAIVLGALLPVKLERLRRERSAVGGVALGAAVTPSPRGTVEIRLDPEPRRTAMGPSAPMARTMVHRMPERLTLGEE